MKPQLNHLIVWSKDRRAAAEFFSEVAGMGAPTEFGHFTQVETGNGVTLDFADAHGDPGGLHLAFLVTERQFDEIFGRILDKQLPYWADPRRSQPGRINHHDGGRGVYFSDPHTNVGWEIITRPYGSGPDERQQTDDINPPVIQEFRANGGAVDEAMGRFFGGEPLLMMHNTAGKTGTLRTNPLEYANHARSHVVAATTSEAPRSKRA